MHPRFARFRALYITIIVFALATPAHAAWPCFRWFAQLIGRKTESITVSTGRVRDQGCYGSCWLQAGAGSLEREAQSKNPDLPGVSIDALIVRDLQRQVDELLHDPTFDFAEGGEGRRARQLVRMYGLVPESQYKIRGPITRDYWAKERFFHQLNQRLDKYRAARAALTTFDRIAEPEKAARQAAFEQVYRETRRDLLTMIEDMAGPVPEEFVVDGQTTTSHEFAKKYFDPTRRAVELIPTQYTTEEERVASAEKAARLERSFGKAQPTYKPTLPALRDVPSNVQSLKKSIPDIQKSILESFRAGKRINVSIVWNDIDLKGSRLDVRTQNSVTNMSYAHAVQVVGVTVKKVGDVETVTEIEVLNSWGADQGKKGRFTITSGYLDRYLLRALID